MAVIFCGIGLDNIYNKIEIVKAKVISYKLFFFILNGVVNPILE